MFETLLVVFVVLKLIGVISWSWWWVTSPIWIAVVLYIFAIVSHVSMMVKFNKNRW